MNHNLQSIRSETHLINPTVNHRLPEESSRAAQGIANVTDNYEYDRTSFRERVKAIGNEYIVGLSSTGDLVIDEKPKTIFEYLRAFFKIRTETEKEKYRRGIDIAKHRIEILYSRDALVLQKFDEEFINPQEISLFSFSFSVPSRYKNGSPLTGNALLRFIEKAERIQSQKKAGTVDAEEGVFTHEHQQALTTQARGLQRTWQDRFLCLSAIHDRLEQEAIAADWLGLVFYSNDPFSTVVKTGDRRFQLTHDEMSKQLGATISTIHEIEAELEKAINKGSWREFAEFIRRKESRLAELEKVEEIERRISEQITGFNQLLGDSAELSLSESTHNAEKAKTEVDEFRKALPPKPLDNDYNFEDGFNLLLQDRENYGIKQKELAQLEDVLTEVEEKKETLENKFSLVQKIITKAKAIAAENSQEKFEAREGLIEAFQHVNVMDLLDDDEKRIALETAKANVSDTEKNLATVMRKIERRLEEQKVLVVSEAREELEREAVWKNVS